MQHRADKRYTLEVRLMDDPCLWRWDIKDCACDAIVASSWEEEWTAYPSKDEAYRAGSERLHRVEHDLHPHGFGRWRFGATA